MQVRVLICKINSSARSTAQLLHPDMDFTHEHLHTGERMRCEMHFPRFKVLTAVKAENSRLVGCRTMPLPIYRRFGYT
jgi:hypothetical protein